MAHGYNGKILRVDLTTCKFEVEEPSEEFYRKYMGGSALAMYYLLMEMPAGVDPLGPENMLIFAASVVTGTAVSGQSRMTAAAKSPLTGAIGDAQGGGFWPAEFKFAGFDAIIIKGKSEKPVYIWIHNGEYEIRDASSLWGKITGEAEAAIQEELDDKKIEVLQIGPAGENAVRFANTLSMSTRANGRTGLGAVMGSKNLKAIAVRGKNRPTVADKARLSTLAKWGSANLAESDIAGLAKYGTPETTGANNSAGGLPTFNYNSGEFEGWEAIDGTTMYDTVLRGAAEGKQDREGRETCYACTVRCKRVVELEGKYNVDPHYGGPEYETTSTFGNYCGIDDLAAISKANELCNKYGMDTISCGATIAWAFEAFNEGKLTLEDTDGLDLSWGNAESMVKLTEMIAKREGFGDVLAEGSERAAKKIGRGTEAYLITSKGQEAPAHMPRVKRSLQVIYATNPFGADHQSHEHDAAIEGDYEYYKDRIALLGVTEGGLEPRVMNDKKIEFMMKSQHMYSAMDSLTLCQFVYGPAWQLYGPADTLELVRSVTGWEDLEYEDIQAVGERRLNMMRAFNAREGLDRKADTLPEKMFKPLKGGPSDGWKLDRDEFESSLDTYYKMSGWDVETGVPARPKLEELGLEWVADLLGV